MKKYIYICICVCMTLVLASCGSNKSVINNASEVPGVSTEKQSPTRTRYEEAIDKPYNFNIFQSRTKYSLKGKTLSGKLSVEHGKRICMTVLVLGIEVARVEANEKTVTIFDKFDKLYTETSIEEMASKLGLEDEMRLDAVECLLLGKMFIPGSGYAEKSDFKKLSWTEQADGTMIGTLSKAKYTLTYTLDANNVLVKTEVKDSASGKSVTMEYSDNQSLDNGVLPGAESVNVNAPGQNINANLTIGAPIKGVLNWTSFTPSDAYRKVTMSELIQAIKNLKN